jgi:tetratricopeptide (TPR) repeat protein
VRTVQRAADEYGITFLSTDVDVDGGKIILLAGAPATTDNDAERLLRAVRAIQDAHLPLKLKIGVNAGTLFAGDVGSPTRAAYTVIGDAVNLAARLMAKADPGQILAEESVMARSQTVFETTPVEPFFVKGKTAAIEAVDVGAVQGTRQRDVAVDPHLFGRDELLAELIGDFAAVAHTGIRLLDIVGPAGIGKTSLVVAARAATDPAAWIKVDCERYEESTSYYALRVLLRWLLKVAPGDTPSRVGQALRDAAERAAPALAPWVPLVATAIGAQVPSTPEVDTLADRFRPERTQDSILQLVAALIPRPVGIVFDNAQWMDESSRALVMRAAVLGAQFPGVVCLVGQNDGPSPPSARRVEVGPLDDASATELAHTVAERHPLPHHRIRDVVERAGGNPLFLASLVEAAMAGEELPANVEDLINANIDALDQNARRVLRCAAVIGTRFHPDLLAASVGDEVADTTDPALWDRLRPYLDDAPTGDKVFRQNLFRDVAYSGLPYHRRRGLHRRVGEALEARRDDENVALLARHFLLAEEYERAWRYSVHAGDVAARKFAHADATDLYDQALRSARRLRTVARADVARVSEAMGTAAEAAGLYEAADAAFAAARARADGDPVTGARLLRRHGLLRERSGRYSVALRWLGRSGRVLDSATDHAVPEVVTSERAQLTVAFAGVRYRQGQYHQCIRACHEALALPGLAAPQEAHARYLLCLALAHLGDPDSEREGRQALAVFDAIGDQLGRANVLNNLGLNAYYRGAWDDAVDLWTRSGQAREACGDIVGSATQTNNLGEIYSDQGKWDEARRCFTEALRIWEGARYGVGIALACSNLGRLDARIGQHERAEEYLERAVSGFEAIGASAFVLEAKVRYVENAARAGRPDAADQARELLATVEATPGAGGLAASLHRVLGVTAQGSGDTDTARSALVASLDCARAAGAPYEEALTLLAIGDVSGDPASTEAAHAILDRMGVRRAQA